MFDWNRSMLHVGEEMRTLPGHSLVMIDEDRLALVCHAECGGLRTRSDLERAFGLSKQEARVALLLVGRRTNREIAASLGVKDKTAHSHVRSLMLKLGVRSRYDVGAIILHHVLETFHEERGARDAVARLRGNAPVVD